MRNVKVKKQGSGARFWQSLRRSFGIVKSNDPLRLAGATAFFTSFALPPIVIILFQLFSLFVSKRVVGARMMEVLRETLGTESAAQIRQTTRGFNTLASNWYIAAGGFIFLLFVATTLFTVIKNSLNDIWNIGVKEKPGIIFNLKLRARSLGIILVAGLLMLTSILIDTVELFAGKYILEFWPRVGPFFSGALNEIIGAAIITLWFIVLFRYLADARPGWRVAIAGGGVTGVLFSIGKTILSFIMSNSNIGNIYGASASIVLILLFVFYSSFILYFGAAFILAYSERTGRPMRLLNQAYRYQVKALKDKIAEGE
jgi:membrane protein